MNVKISNKITKIRPLLVLMVVLIHSERAFRLYLEPTRITQYIIALFQGNICRIAVPMLFVFSGYLFFAKYDKGISNYVKLIQKKCKRLLLPYLVINAAIIIICLFIKLPGISGKITLDSLDIAKYFGLLRGGYQSFILYGLFEI